MSTKRISMTFLIILVGLFTLPMIFINHWWGMQFGWPWGFYNLIIPGYGTTNFQWIWEVFLVFPSIDVMFYFALAAVIGVVIDVALLITSILASSRRGLTIVTALANVAFGVIAILVTAIYTTAQASFVFSPLGILLIVGGGIALYQILKS